jgi:hypothetical protein
VDEELDAAWDTREQAYAEVVAAKAAMVRNPASPSSIERVNAAHEQRLVLMAYRRAVAASERLVDLAQHTDGIDPTVLADLVEHHRLLVLESARHGHQYDALRQQGGRQVVEERIRRRPWRGGRGR